VAPAGLAGSMASAGSADGTANDLSRPRGKRARVVEVTDGDSIKVRLVRSDAPRNVRLIGIDTPEVHGQRECGGPEAGRSLRRMLPVGAVVRLVRDPHQDNRDLFNRLLRYVEKPGGADLGRKQVRLGWARVFIFGGETFERKRSYRRAMRAAKDAERGTWGLC
jgi:endonuclease YncB( thermonuclease family)